jgi:hypothetical protein
MMAHEDALDLCRKASAHLNDYLARMGGRSWAANPATDDDPLQLINAARAQLAAYIARISRVTHEADVIVTFDGADLPVQVEWDEGEAYPSHVAINGKWLDVAETWLSFEPASTHLTDVVRDAIFEQAKIDAAP